jgi:hypothetical protein
VAILLSRSFFAMSLLLPVLAAALGCVVPNGDFLLFYFVMGAIPYVLVALPLLFFILKARSLRDLLILSIAAPFLFGAAVAIFVDVAGRLPGIYAPVRIHILSGLRNATLGGLCSSFFVAVTWGLWAVGRKLGWVKNELAS